MSAFQQSQAAIDLKAANEKGDWKMVAVASFIIAALFVGYTVQF